MIFTSVAKRMLSTRGRRGEEEKEEEEEDICEILLVRGREKAGYKVI